MKKLISLILTLSLIFSLSLPTGAALTTTDALNILKAAAGTITLTAEQQAKYDLDGDGKISTADAVLVLKSVAGASGGSSAQTAPPSATPPINDFTRVTMTLNKTHFLTVSDTMVITVKDIPSVARVAIFDKGAAHDASTKGNSILGAGDTVIEYVAPVLPTKSGDYELRLYLAPTWNDLNANTHVVTIAFTVDATGYTSDVGMGHAG